MQTTVKQLLEILDSEEKMVELALFLKAESLSPEDEVYITLIKPENKCIYINDITKVSEQDLMAISKAVKAILKFRAKDGKKKAKGDKLPKEDKKASKEEKTPKAEVKPAKAEVKKDKADKPKGEKPKEGKAK